MPVSGADQAKVEASLKELLTRLASSSGSPTFAQLEVELLAGALSPGSTKDHKNLAFLCLTKLVDSLNRTSASPEAAISAISEPWIPLFSSWDLDSSPSELIPPTALLGALFPLAPASAASLLSLRLARPSDDAPSTSTPPPPLDVLSVLLEASELPSPLQLVFADMLVQAGSSKLGRAAISPRADAWLHGAMNGDDAPLAALCAAALTKLRRPPAPGDGTGATAAAGEREGVGDEEVEEVEMADRMMRLILSSSKDATSAALLPTLEGLAILSLKPAIKDHLSRSPSFLRALLALSPTWVRGGSLPVTPRGSMDVAPPTAPVDTGLCYGITLIIVNLTSRKPVLSEQDQQIAKLRAMAIAGKRATAVPEEDEREGEEAVKERVRALVNLGVISCLRGLATGQSRAVKEGLGRLCLNLVVDTPNRMVFIRDGGFRVLSSVIRDLTTSATSSKTPPAPSPIADASPDTDILPSLQALAKLVITTPPHLLFPPPHLTTCLDALTPLYHLLIHPSSTLLQVFEALMGLTNLASIDSSIGDRIVDASIKPLVQESTFLSSDRESTVSVISKVEEYMLSDTVLVQRAATELVCNLVGSPQGFANWVGTPEARHPRSAQRLNILLVLTDVLDLKTRLAASGALAFMSESPLACQAMIGVGEAEGKSTWRRIAAMYDPEEHEEEGEKIAVINSQPPDEGLLLRATVLLLNLVGYVADLPSPAKEAEKGRIKEAGVEGKLMDLIKSRQVGREVLEPAVETLKMLKRL